MPKSDSLKKFPELKLVIEEFFTTLHEMTCDRLTSTKNIPQSRIYTNFFIIGWFFVQLSSYLAEVTRKDMNSKFFDLIRKCQSYSRIIPILSDMDSVMGVLTANVVIFFTNMFFFLFASTLTFYNIVYERRRLKRSHWAVVIVGKIYWWFAEVFNWILFMPFLEAAVLLLFQLQKKDFSYIYLFLGCLNCIVCFFVAVVVNFFSNNYNFNTKGTLKQRFQSFKNLQTITITLAIFFLLSSMNSKAEITHALLHVTGILLLADFSRLGTPYQEKPLSLFYFSSILVAESYAVIMSLREFTKLNEDEVLFYTWMSIASFMIVISRKFINAGWTKSLNVKYNSGKLENICIFYEEVIDMAESSFDDPVKYMKLLGWVRFHRSQCFTSDCYCKQPYWDEIILQRGDLKMESFVEWVEKMFLQKVQTITRSTSQGEAESFLLKYFSFLMRYYKNFVKTHFEINFEGYKLGNKLSFHYRTICRGYQNIIQDKLGIHKSSASTKDIETYKQHVNFDKFVNSESVKVECRRQLAVLLEQKIQYWQHLIDGYESYNDFYKVTRNIMQGINQLQSILENELRKSPEDLIFLKLNAILSARLTSNPVMTSKIERKLNDMKKKDSTKDLNTIHTISIMKGNVISLVASFLDDYGKIITFSDGAPRFFGYSRTEFSTFRNINNVMPPIFSVVHDALVNRLIYTGQEKIIKKYRPAVSMYKNGTIFLCKLFVTYFFPLIEDFAFSALFLKITSDSIFFLLSPSMRIQGICEKGMKTFEVPEELVKGFSFLNLGILLPDVFAIIENFNKYGTAENIRTKMVIPVHIRDVIEFFMNYTKLNQDWENTPLDQISQKVEQFVASHSEFFAASRIFQVSMNVIRDNVKLISGEFLVIYIVEIHDCYELDDLNVSEHSIPEIKFTKIESKNLQTKNTLEPVVRHARSSFIFNNASDILKVRKVAIKMQEERTKRKNGRRKTVVAKKLSSAEASPKQSPLVNEQMVFPDFPEAILEESPTLAKHKTLLTPPDAKKEENEEFEIKSTSRNSPTSRKVNVFSGDFVNYDFNSPLGKQEVESGNSKPQTNKGINLKSSGAFEPENTLEKAATGLLSPNGHVIQETFFPRPIVFGTTGARRATYTSQQSEKNEIRLVLQRYSSLENSAENQQEAPLQNLKSEIYENSLNQSAGSKGQQLNPSTKNSNHSPETSESCSISLDGHSHGFVDSIKLSEEKTKKKSPVLKKPDYRNPVHPASVGSSTSSLTNAIVSIHNLVTEKRVPMIVKSLYISMFFKLLTFVTLLIVYNVYTANIYERYKNILQHVSFGAKLTAPVMESINLINKDALKDLLMDMKLVSYNESNLNTENIFDKKVLNSSLESYKATLTSHLGLVSDFPFQTQFLLWETDLERRYLSSIVRERMNFVQFLKNIYGSLYDIYQKYGSNFTYDDPNVYVLIKNFPILLQKVPEYMDLTDQEIGHMSETLNSFNKGCLSIAISILFLATILMLPAYKKYTAYIERILSISSKVNQMEAQAEIDLLKDSLDMLNSYDQYYLNVDYSSYSQNEIEEWKQKSNMKKQPTTGKQLDKIVGGMMATPAQSSRQNLLSERIKSANISSINFVVFILILFFLASAFYIGVYVYVQNFPVFVTTPLNTLKSYFSAVTKFNSIPAENELVLLGNFLSKSAQANSQAKNFFFYDDQYLDELRRKKSEDLQIVSHHFETEIHSILFKDIQIDEIRRLNSEELCDMITDYGCNPTYCRSLLKGVLSRGLQMGLTVMITDLKSDEDIINFAGLEEVKNLLANAEYHERSVVLMIINHVLYRVIMLLEDYLRGKIEEYMMNTKLIFLFGSLIFMVFFLMIVITYFNKLQQNYYKVNQGLQLLPAVKLSSDQHKGLIKSSASAKNPSFIIDVSNNYKAALYIYLICFDIIYFIRTCINVEKINIWKEKVNKSKLLCMNANLLLLISVILPFFLMLIFSISCKIKINLIWSIKSGRREPSKWVRYLTSFMNFSIVAVMILSLLLQSTHLNDWKSSYDYYICIVYMIVATTGIIGLYFIMIFFYMLCNLTIMYEIKPEFYKKVKHVGIAVIISIFCRIANDVLSLAWGQYNDFRDENLCVKKENWGWAFFLFFYFNISNNVPIIFFNVFYSVHVTEKPGGIHPSGKASSLLDPIERGPINDDDNKSLVSV